ncbi:flagellar hook protein FlgE [Paracraurococcus lichenis]|uniref:Flagellar hook protein FlgE n=1 Tax=Paracraurococcus lichenis TaxID=3064888 RepID=A0ABT9E0V1_9PROT|nr:flagellar hook protein FlgE [Paracraurococcus sp. LOR1-02]MDO9709802.1 flagellar hook protein FlgE [Paracraurococcus sp. LOR1-02]
MSLFGSLTAAISGLTAQSRALGDISDNVANSQTIGFKRVDTSFTSYITESSATVNEPGAVVARPDYTNTIQGTIQQSENSLALAISGQGFFSVAASTGTANGLPTFDYRQFFTRAGDFKLDRDGYMVNGSGYYLRGWPVDSAGNPDRTTLTPIRVNQQVFNPVATKQVDFTANLPSGSANGATYTTQAEVYDSLGTKHPVNLSFSKTAADTWTLDINVPDDVSAAARGTVSLQFGAAATPPATGGTLGSFSSATGSITPPATNAQGDPANLTFTADFGQGPQTVSLALGQFGLSQGMTQYDTAEFAVRNNIQDGVPLGAYSGLTLRQNGDVVVNYDNGQSRVLARVPLVAFNDPELLQRLDGQAFMRTPESGEARVTDAASNGVGKLVTGSVESSNVDIASEFTKLIVAQRAYSANTKIVSTTDEMLQDTINMRR